MTKPQLRRHYTFIQVLQETLVTRAQKNPKYSLRAYARDLGVSVSTLSRLLNGQLPLNPTMFERLLARLKIPSSNVEFQRELYKIERMRHREKLYILDKRNPRIIDQLRLISEPDHQILLSYLTLHQPIVYDITFLAKQTLLTQERIQEIIDRLLRLGLLTVKDSHILTRIQHRHFHMAAVSGCASEASEIAIVLEVKFLPRLLQEIEEFHKRVSEISGMPEDLTSSDFCRLSLKSVQNVAK